MRLSVIIPVYNAEKYIASCLESVLSQGIEDLEILCIDDASTDGSAEAVEEFMQKDPRVRLIRNQKNLYAGACRNIGIENAKGEYIHFLDADDLAEEGIYRKVLSLAETCHADVIKGRGIKFSMKDGDMQISYAGPLLEMTKVDESYVEKPFSFLEHPEVLTEVSVVPWNGIYRRELLVRQGIRFNHLVCVNDRSFYNEVTIAAETIVLTRECFVRYRQSESGSLMNRRARNFECEFASYRIVEEQLSKYNISGEAKRIVLERELKDILYWYKMYCRLPEGVGDSIRTETRKFIEETDMRVFEKTDPKESFMRTYRYIIGKETLSDRLMRTASETIRKVRRS